MSECGQRSVQGEIEMICTKSSGNHRFCSGWNVTEEGFSDWPNPNWAPPKAQPKSVAIRTIHAVAVKMQAETPPMS
jgi:hypothetical protein